MKQSGVKHYIAQVHVAKAIRHFRSQSEHPAQPCGAVLMFDPTHGITSSAPLVAPRQPTTITAGCPVSRDPKDEELSIQYLAYDISILYLVCAVLNLPGSTLEHS